MFPRLPSQPGTVCSEPAQAQVQAAVYIAAHRSAPQGIVMHRVRKHLSLLRKRLPAIVGPLKETDGFLWGICYSRVTCWAGGCAVVRTYVNSSTHPNPDSPSQPTEVCRRRH